MADKETYNVSKNNPPSSGNGGVPGHGEGGNPNQPTIIIQNYPSRSGWWSRVIMFILGLSILMNISLIAANPEFAQDTDGPKEKFHKGDKQAPDKIALIEVSGTIMPPLTERTLKNIEKAEKDDKVKGILLVVDSPGGLVADSHQIYHRLKQLSEKKKIYVQMKRLAASGGYYISMGAGPQAKIYAEPTTWTGSIGVIMPRYDFSEFAKTWGIKSDPLTTGEFKNTLDPLKPLNEEERQLWGHILDQSYKKFMSIIDDNRDTMNAEDVKKIATGQIFTADDAMQNHLIDAIGFEEDATADLKKALGLENVKIVKYEHTLTFSDLLSSSAKAPESQSIIRDLMESSVPRAMYFFAWSNSGMKP
jgi:protease-4